MGPAGGHSRRKSSRNRCSYPFITLRDRYPARRWIGQICTYTKIRLASPHTYQVYFFLILPRPYTSSAPIGRSESRRKLPWAGLEKCNAPGQREDDR